VAVGLAIALIATVAACVRSTSSPTPTRTSTETITSPGTSTPQPTNSGPLSTATVSEKTVAACPYISEDEASSDTGFRLDRITELIQAGEVVGCRFYALQNPTAQCDEACVRAENLPPGNVPGVEIRATKYSSSLNAHNAFVTTAKTGTDYQQVEIGTGNIGVCYRTTVWTQDGGRDWACAFSKGATEIVIRTSVTDPPLNVVQIANAIERHF
jgi:hypothetical protein